MAILVILSIAIVHRLMIKEEIHLLAMHASNDDEYKNQIGRYFPHFVKSKSGGN